MTIAENYPPEVLLSNMNLLGTHDSPLILTALVDDFDGTREEKASRFLSAAQYCDGIEKLQMAAFIQYALPGSPSIYYADEAGMEGHNDPFNRRTYPWGRENPGLLAHFRTLGQLRKNHAPLRLGSIQFLYARDGKICFRRSCDGRQILCYVNCSAESWDIPAKPLLFEHNTQAVAPTWLRLQPMGYCMTEET
jgi:glycosidase